MAVINGTAGNDTLFGTSSDDQINGLGGHDYLRGGGGNDVLAGGDGDDYLDGGAGDDVLDGGAGIDRAAFHTSPGGVHVDLGIQGVAQDTGFGFDTLIDIENLSGTFFTDTLTGNGGDNWIWGEGGDDTISAGGGNDLVEVGVGNALLDGGTGNDTLSFLDEPNGVSGATASLALQGTTQVTGVGSINFSGFENLSGTTFNDVLSGDGGSNLLAGDSGDDVLSGGAGNDTIYGDGRVIVDSHDSGTSGPITTYADVFVLDGEADGNDVIEGGLGDDIINGGGGSDTASYAHASGSVNVNLGTGFSNGADGHDTLVSIENLTGSAFDDVLRGNALANHLAGGDGHDLLRGGDGNDVVDGGNGDDYLDGGNGGDMLNGGAGLDRVAYSIGATAGVTVDLNIVGVAQNTGSAGFDTLNGIEHVSGTRFDDVLTGDGGDNWLWGGSDSSGVTGNDTISGGGGNDLVEIGTGNHVLSGGAGVDTWSLYGNETDISAAGVTVSLALQGAAQDTEQGMMNATGFENLSGSIYDDNLTGDGGNNLLAGDRGGDMLAGGAGDDILYGDGRVMVDTHGVGTSGPIVTIGDVGAAFGETDGNDVLDGGKGNDILVGGGGDDRLTGGQGNDQFVFGAHSGHDTITDFAKKDQIVFSADAGAHGFSDLTLTASGKDTLISWGTGDSILVEGMKPKQMSASDFSFAPAGGAAPMALAAGDLHDAAHHAGAWMP